MKYGLRFLLTTCVIYFSSIVFPNSIILMEGLRTAIIVTLLLFLGMLLTDVVVKYIETNVFKLANPTNPKNLLMPLIILLSMSIFRTFIFFAIMFVIEKNYGFFEVSNTWSIVLLSIAIWIFTSEEKPATLQLTTQKQGVENTNG